MVRHLTRDVEHKPLDDRIRWLDTEFTRGQLRPLVQGHIGPP
jgi:hypothetical protein